MAEDLPDPDNRMTIDATCRIRVSRVARGVRTHKRLMRRAKRLLHDAGYDVIATQPFDISMNAHMCGTTVAGVGPQTT